MNKHYVTAAEHAPQLANEETANESYLSEQGITDETMQFSALNRVAEAQLAVAYELRTANLIALWSEPAPEIDGVDYKEVQGQLRRRLDLPEPPQPKPVQHYRVGPGKCNCGWDAYTLRGIMIDYHEELQAHLRSNR